MKNLSDLAPAQTLLLIEGKSVPLKDMLKVTLMDLFLKQVLKTTEVSNGANAASHSNTYTLTGDSFSSYKALPHETVFFSPFRKDPKSEILFANLVKIGYQRAESQKKYNKLVRGSEALKGCFASGLSGFFSPFELISEGLKISKALKSQLNSLSETLPDLMENNPDKALEVLKLIKGNIFLVKGIDFKRMAEIEKTVMAEIYSTHSASNGTLADPVTWILLDINSRTFDSSCSGCSSSDPFDSDPGDSGCSGCGSD